MRELIRPTLFVIARTGLFLAIVVWILGQWWIVRGKAPCSGRCYELVIGSKGLVGGVDSYPVGWQFSVHRDTPDDMSMDSFEPESISHLRKQQGAWFVQLPGLTIFTIPAWGYTLTMVRHWLIAATFALFFGLLKWVYRKGEMKPAE